MVVCFRFERSGFNAQSATHSEVNSEPVVAGKFKEHLFSVRARTKEFLPRNLSFEHRHVRAAEDSFFAVQLHCDDDVAQSRIPAFTKVLHLGQLWHAVPSFPTVSEVWLRLLEEYGL